MSKPVKDAFAQLGGANGKLYAKQLHDLAVNQDDPQIRIKALAIIAPYVWRKQVERHEHSGPEGGAVHVHHHFAA